MIDHLAIALNVNPLSKEHLERIDAEIEQIRLNPEEFKENQRGSKNNHYGCKHSEETKRKLSEINRQRTPRSGWQHTEASKRKISEAKKGIRPNRDYSNPWNKGLKYRLKKDGL